MFVAPDGDHYRVRLTHSLEVAQIARTLARALGLNEDLTEALALAHDIGHPPFGHAGEDVLQAAMAEAGGFDHNAHTIRLLTRLESPYPRFAGLNLSWETLEGLAKHNGPVAAAALGAGRGGCANGRSSSAPGRGSRRRSRRSPTTSPTTITTSTTACAPGLFTLDELLAVPLVARAWAAVKARYPGVAEARLVPELVRDLIGAMVNDVLAETRARGRGRSDRPRRCAPPAARSPASPTAMAAEERALKAFLHARMYDAPSVTAVRAEAQAMLAALFAAYRADPRPPAARMAPGRRRRDCRPARHRRLHRRHDRPLRSAALRGAGRSDAPARDASEPANRSVKAGSQSSK